ncbi:hypothetical protein Btru_078123 [Bulinus truncatus]|nr:hypothetical protein Btru_078123 [Bulinus truncatus]
MENGSQRTINVNSIDLYESERNENDNSTGQIAHTSHDNHLIARELQQPALPTPNVSAIDPYINIINGHRYLCLFGPPSVDFRLRSVTVRRKVVPLNTGQFICRPAMGYNEHQIEVEMSELDSDTQNRLFHDHHHHHCRYHHRRSHQSRCSSSGHLSSALSALSLSSSILQDCCGYAQGSAYSDLQSSGHGVARCINCETDFTKLAHFKRISLLSDAMTEKSLTVSCFSSEAAEAIIFSSAISTGNKSRYRPQSLKKSLATVKFNLPRGDGDALARGEVSLGRNNSNSSTKERAPQSDNIKFAGRIVHVEGDGRCLFRSLVAASNLKLQQCKRDEYGRPTERTDADDEKWMADELREKVVNFMNDNLHFYSQLGTELINADQPSSTRYSVFRDRLVAMSKRHTMPGDLELNAASAVLEQTIAVLNSDLEVICVYGDDRYPESTPLTVRFTRLGDDVGHYDAVILDSSSDNARSRFQKAISYIKDKIRSLNSKIPAAGGADMAEGKCIMDVTDTYAPQHDCCTNNHWSNSSDADQKCSNNSRLDSKMNLQRDAPQSVSASTQTSESKSPRRRKRKRRNDRKTRRSGGGGKGKCGTKRRAPQDRNYNRKRSTASRKRSRSFSFDSSTERQRKKRRRVVAACPTRDKRKNRHGRIPKTKRGYRSAQRGVRRRKTARAEARYVLVKLPRSESDRDCGAIPGWNVIRPKSPVTPKAFVFGPLRCFLCRKKDTARSSRPTWLRCYLCGRSAHQECAVKESRAWSPGQWDDPYFICNNCVP